MLHYRSEGVGKTIVFLHGFMESMSMWEYLSLEQLSFQKIFIDLPGHGKSVLNTDLGTPSMQFYCDEVISVLNHLSINEFSVVGHSMGGYVALLLKEQMAKCDKVVLLNSNYWSDSELKKKDRIRMADIAFKAKKMLIQEAIPNLFGNSVDFQVDIDKLKSEAMQMSPEAIAYASLAMRERNDFTDELHKNAKDYFLIHGMQDRLIDAENLQARFTKKNRLFLIENAGHMAHIETSKQVLEILKEIFN